MKIVSFIHKRRAHLGVIDGDRLRGIAWNDSLLDLIERGLRPEPTSEHFPLDEITLRPPLLPGKILGIGRNYAEHAAELSNELPSAPLIFAKLTSSVIANDEAITWRESMTTQVDWEGELAVIIGRRAYGVSEADAMNHVYGYTIVNDISARDIQKSESQWVRAKGLNTFCPMGPCLVTRDEIVDPHALSITTTVSGEVMQQASTGLMIFRIPYLIAYCSQAFTLEPGDMIMTGTPAGVGSGMKPPRFLQHGDLVTVTIDGIGTLQNPCHVL